MMGDVMTPEQCKGARAVLGWSQNDLSDRCKVSAVTIARFEKGASPPPAAPYVLAIQTAIEKVGVEFGGEDGRSSMSWSLQAGDSG